MSLLKILVDGWFYKDRNVRLRRPAPTKQNILGADQERWWFTGFETILERQTSNSDVPDSLSLKIWRDQSMTTVLEESSKKVTDYPTDELFAWNHI